MNNNPTHKSLVTAAKIALAVILVSSIANCAYLLSIPSDIKNAVFLNLSANRLLLVLFFVIVISLSVVGFLLIKKKSNRYIRLLSGLYENRFWISAIILFLFIIFFSNWIAFFSPPYFLEEYQSIAERLRPLLLWALTVNLIIVLLGIFIKNNLQFKKLFANAKFLSISVIASASVFSLFTFVIIVYPRLTNDLWFGRYSVPILATQVLFSLMMVMVLKQLVYLIDERTPTFIAKNIDWIAFILIWLVSIFLWTRQPIEFMDGMFYTAIEQHIRPLPPNYEVFPLKDSRTYYQVAESVKIGKGIYRSIDKSLFLAVGSVINWLADSSFNKMLNLQIVLLAFFPPVVYLLGKELHNREAGLLGALLAVFQEINGINLMDEFPVVSSKVFLSEPYMQLWNGLIALAVVIALKKHFKKNGPAFLISGSVLGLSALFRLNTIVVIPFILIVIFIKYLKDKKKLIRNASLFLIGILLAFTPWMIHNTVVYGNPIKFINSKVKGVIVDRRYEKITSQNDTQLESFDDHSIILASLIAPQIETLHIQDRFIDGLSTADNIPELPGLIFQQEYFQESGYLELGLSVLRHFLNNITTSFSILPASFIPQDLFHGARHQQFWGSYDPELYVGMNFSLIVISLLIISLGIAKAFEKNRIAGLVPLAVYLGYHLSNALAISSGNRYAQPASWIVFFYYVLGLVVICDWFIGLIIGRSQKETAKKKKARGAESTHGIKGWYVIPLILLIGSMPAAADLLPVDRFPEVRNEELTSAILENKICQSEMSKAGFGDAVDFTTYLEEGEYSAAIGRVISPISVDKDEYQQIFIKSKRIFETDNAFLTFSLINESAWNPIKMFFYSDNPEIDLANGDDVVVISNAENEVAALGVIDSGKGRISADTLSQDISSCFIIEK